MKLRKSLFLIFYYALIIGKLLSVEEKDISITANYTKNTVKIGDFVELNIKIEWQGPSEKYFFSWPEKIETENLNIVNKSFRIKTYIYKGNIKNTAEFIIKLEPDKKGTASVLPFDIPGVSINEVQLKLPVSPGDIEVETKIFTAKRIIIFLVIIFILICISGVYLYITQKRKKRKQEKEKEIILTPEEKYYEIISGIEKSTRSLSDRSSELVKYIKEYFYESLGIKWKSKATGQYIKELKKHINDTKAVSFISDILTYADRLRFSIEKENPEELSQHINRFLEYLKKHSIKKA